MGRGKGCIELNLDDVARSAPDTSLPDLIEIDIIRGPRLLGEIAEEIRDFSFKRDISELKGIINPLLSSNRAMEMLIEAPPSEEAIEFFDALFEASLYNSGDSSIQGHLRSAYTTIGAESVYSFLIVSAEKKEADPVRHLRSSTESARTLCNKKIGKDWMAGEVRGSFTHASYGSYNPCEECLETASALPPSARVRVTAEERWHFDVADHHQVALYKRTFIDWMRASLASSNKTPTQIVSFLTDAAIFKEKHLRKAGEWAAIMLLDVPEDERLSRIFELPPGFTPDDPMKQGFDSLQEMIISHYSSPTKPLEWPRTSQLYEPIFAALKEEQGGRYKFITRLVSAVWPEAAKEFVSGSYAISPTSTMAEMIEEMRVLLAE